jgi:uncharacterized protein with HEPN domain
MYNKREIIDFLEDAVNAMDKAEFFIGDMRYEDFAKDEKTIFAVIRAIEIIGEAIKHVASEIRQEFGDIPWRGIAGMRDVLVHEYFGVDFETVWKTVKEDMPSVRPQIVGLMNHLKKKSGDQP